MANDKFLPTRPIPDDFTTIKAADKDCLAYALIMGAPNDKAFLLFHPEFSDEQGKLTKVGRTQSRQFFAYAKNREFQDALRHTIEKQLGGKAKLSVDDSTEISESRKDEALKMLFNKALQVVESGGELDPDTLKVTTEIFRKLGILKEDVEVQEAPRRYLPERCSSCRYKQFIDEQVRLGNIEETAE